jgi:hypothetical protein
MSKTQISKLDVPAGCEKIKRISENPALVAEQKKLDDFKAQKKQAEKDLTNAYEGTTTPTPEFSETTAENVASKIVSGETSLNDLDFRQTSAGAKEKLRRKIEILDKVILIQTEKCRMMESNLIRQICESELEPIAKKIVGETIAAFEQLHTAMKNEAAFFYFLSCRGYAEGYRPAGWLFLPYCDRILFGSDNFPSLVWFIEQRKKIWGFPVDEKINQKSK